MKNGGAQIINKLNIRAIIGKGTTGKKMDEACKEHRCVHLTNVGVAGALLLLKAKVNAVYW